MEESSATPVEASAPQSTADSTPMAADAPTVPGAAVPLDTPMDQDPPQEGIPNNNVTETPVDAELKSDARPSSAANDVSADANAAAPQPSTSADSAPSAVNESSVQQSNETTAKPSAAPADAQPSKPRLDLGSLPTRQYLDQTVVPILLRGLTWLAKTRPDDPVSELAKYLLDHKSECDWTFPQSTGASAFSGDSSAVSGASQGK